MLRDFKAFLIKENILGLALAVVIGTALGKVVASIVDNLIMPIVAVLTPAGEWREWTTPGPVPFGIGAFAGSVIDFLIIGFVVWRATQAFVKPPATTAPATKPCPFCRMSIDGAATRSAHCTSQLGEARPAHTDAR
ncbi:MAG: MscL family protein [Gemmatimonadota bacterium]|nr:MscL family protein [Gemmatimonadota bacterium]